MIGSAPGPDHLTDARTALVVGLPEWLIQRTSLLPGVVNNDLGSCRAQTGVSEGFLLHLISICDILVTHVAISIDGLGFSHN